MPCYASSCGRVTLYLGDWETLPSIPCDAVVTDPPYGIEADKAKAHSSIRDNGAWPESEWDKQRPAAETLRKLPTLADLVDQLAMLRNVGMVRQRAQHVDRADLNVIGLKCTAER